MSSLCSLQAFAVSRTVVSTRVRHHRPDPIRLSRLLNVLLSQNGGLVRNSNGEPCPDRYERKRLSVFAGFSALLLKNNNAEQHA
jgi:hypothetical protein